MSYKFKKWIHRGSLGLFFGAAFYLIISIVAELFLDWFVPFVNQKYQFEEPITIKAIYAVAITLSWGLRVPFNFMSNHLSLLLTSVLSGTIGMFSFLIVDERKVIFVFLVLFAMLFLPIAFLGFVMMIT